WSASPIQPSLSLRRCGASALTCERSTSRQAAIRYSRRLRRTNGCRGSTVSRAASLSSARCFTRSPRGGAERADITSLLAFLAGVLFLVTGALFFFFDVFFDVSFDIFF